jgi:hypothetical protein
LLKSRSIWLRHLYLALSCGTGSRRLLFDGMTASIFDPVISSRMMSASFLQSAGLAARILHLIGRGGTGGVTGQAALTGLQNSFDQT